MSQHGRGGPALPKGGTTQQPPKPAIPAAPAPKGAPMARPGGVKPMGVGKIAAIGPNAVGQLRKTGGAPAPAKKPGFDQSDYKSVTAGLKKPKT